MEREKIQLPKKRNIKYLIAAVIIVILLLVMVIVLKYSSSQTPVSSTLQPSSTPSSQTSSPVQYQMNVESVPAPLTQDFSNAVSSTIQNEEYKFLTDGQKKELESSSMVTSQTSPASAQIYTVSWSDNAISSKVPSLSQTVPVYFIARPSDKTIFSVIKETASFLGIKGSVIRTDNQTYSVGNVSTGTFPLTLDLYHMSLTASNLNLPGADQQAVKDTLTKAGLLNFPSTQSRQTDQTGGVWYRFTPQLALPVISLDQPGSSFTPGAAGSIDVAVDKNNSITRIQAMFPNVVQKGTVALARKDEIVKRITSGPFLKGDIALQYPGATSLTDKRKFFSLQADNNISITGAQIDSVTCGYFLNTDQTIQTILPPACQAAGRGTVGGFPVIFRVIVSAVE